MDEAPMSWIDEEFSGCKFADKRLGKRLLMLIEQLGNKIGSTIPTACQDWSNTKAAYRFFSNPRLSELEILDGHFQSTKSRFKATTGPILVLHDTTEMTFNTNQPQDIGYTRKCANKMALRDQKVKRAMCGVLMHSSLALTPEGLPLGFTAKKLWNRDKFKNVKALYRRTNATRIPIEKKESYRWIEGVRNSNELLGNPERLIHIGDREADIYDFFHAAEVDKSHYLVRIKVNRRTEDETKTIEDVMSSAKVRGRYKVSHKAADGKTVDALLQVKFEEVTIRPPFGIKSKTCSDMTLRIIHAKEISTPGKGREAIDWKLVTNLPVKCLADATEKLQWYALRWKIEVFFKILKSGCKVEDSKLRTAESLCKLIAIYSVLAWRVFWMTMINRASSGAPSSVALSSQEMKILDILKPDKKPSENTTLSTYLIKIARLGGYLARAHDPPPGNIVMWRGIARLSEIQMGVEIGKQLVGN